MSSTKKREEPTEGRHRVVVEGVAPEIDCGRFPVKRVVGDDLIVEADAFADGHDRVDCVLLHRTSAQKKWRETPMEPLGNDRWRGSFPLEETGRYHYSVLAWVDRYGTWRSDLEKRIAAEQDVRVDLRIGAGILADAAERAEGERAGRLEEGVALLRDAAEVGPGADLDALTTALDDEFGPLARAHADRSRATRYARELEVVVDRELARFSAWYEFFPRSTGPGTEHGTFEDAEKLLPYVRGMGFDIVYLPPIHPIGREKRKGPNNTPEAGPDDPGSPWAMGAAEGGHTSVHPDLGTLEEFRSFRQRAKALGMEVALDIAFQAAPDHPWVEEHPEWFRERPDGTIQYAENPPKKYQDIYPFDFETEDWRALWEALRDVMLFWIEQGVKVFRVDNPHTKAFPFWEWAIGTIKRDHPEVIFLSEAFTRPKVMYRLAKLGFTQSYTYFAWRNTKRELTDYLTELTTTEAREFFRPNFWPNTPDILNEYLQAGGRPAFMIRHVLAATLAASYGIYGPAFELVEREPREEGSEEYLDSEKYQIRDWDLEQPASLRDFIARVNRIRREWPALRWNRTLHFHPTDNEQILCFSKTARAVGHRPGGGRDDPWRPEPPAGRPVPTPVPPPAVRGAPEEVSEGALLVVVNLDPHHAQSGWLDLHLHDLGLEAGERYEVRDLLGDARHVWEGSRNYVEIDPRTLPAHVFRIRRTVHSEKDFEFYEGGAG